MIVFSALFTASIVAGAYVTIPIGPVPITLQTLFVMLAGLLGGFRTGLFAVMLYLLLGLIGLPVFSGGIGGFAHFISPTGGFLLGLIPMVAIVGIGGKKLSNTVSQTIVTVMQCFGANVALYAAGLPFLKMRLVLDWKTTITLGLLPFIVGDVIKIAAAVVITRLYRSKAADFLGVATKGDQHVDS